MFEEMTNDNEVNLNPSIAYRLIGDELWLASSPLGGIRKLNEVGGTIWMALAEGKEVKSIIDMISKSYSIEPMKVSVDVQRFLEQLFTAGLISVNGRHNAIKAPAGKLDEDRALLLEAAERRIPIRVQFELTHRCNLRCQYCSVVKTNRDGLKTSEVVNILNQIAASGCLFLTLTGGEILMRQDFTTILEHAAHLKFGITLLTNGTLLSPRLAKDIASVKTIGVCVSLHSTLPELHNAFTTVTRSFHRAVNAIEMLVAEGVPTTIFFNVTRLNYQESHAMQQLAKRLGAELLCNVLIIPTFDRRLHPIDYRAPDEGVRQVFEMGLMTPRRTRCSAGKSRAKITALGDVTPCEIVNIVVGNIRQQLFEEIWRSKQLDAFLKSGWFDTPPQCAQCQFFDDCLYCPGLSYLESLPSGVPSTESCRLARLYSDAKQG